MIFEINLLVSLYKVDSAHEISMAFDCLNA